MLTIQQLREQRATAFDRMTELSQLGQTRALTDDERAEYDRVEAEFDQCDAEIARRERQEQRAERMSQVDRSGIPTGAHGEDEDRPAASLGQHFANEVGERIREARAEGSRFAVSSSEFRNAAADTQVTGGNTGVLGPVLTDVDTNIVTGVRRRLTVADLLAPGTLDGSAITYFVEGALEGDFTTVAEGAQKPQIHFADPTAVTEALKKIAAFIKESDEMIEDLPFLVSAINGRLLYQLGLFEENQLLSGNGSGTNLRGLLNRSGIQTLGAGTDTAKGNPDTIFKALTAVSTGSGLDADGIIINPTDYQALRLSKDANDQYYGGGFFQGQYGQGGVAENPPLWGMRTVVTPAIAAGTVLVGAFQQSSTLYRKGGVRVEATNSNENDFTNNKVTIRAEERVALAVRKPAGLVKVTLGNA